MSAQGTAAEQGLRVQRVQAAYRQVADQLKERIVGGELAPGTRLPSESELSRMFGASRSTIREALRLLASQNLINTTRGVTGGSFVSSPDVAAIAENLSGSLGLLVNNRNLTVAHLLEARLILEPVAARLAAERADEQALADLHRATTSTHQMAPARGFVVHWDFHEGLVAATGNPLLEVMCQPINEVLRGRLHRDRVERAAWDAVDHDHVGIYEAVASGDGAEAERLTRAHLLELRGIYEQMGDDAAD
ncbi:FadR/GntR family transcriptional regulator [Nocardia sp. BMG51109]|uniref:FadR/GntR family transcriptional regulator n=1 Tax=Nocardia sp. BMG51109 TaxID=1056816 RepID=UPI000463F589|nr:FCD domain-containing protein [Nocardia sp. BMG51109]